MLHTSPKKYSCPPIIVAIMYLPGYLIMIIKTHSTSLKLPFSIEKCKNFSREEEKIRIKEENFMRDDLPGIINCVLLPPRRP